MRRAGDLLAAEFTNQPSPQVTRRLGSVVSASEDGTATVLLDGDEVPTVGVRLVASCASVAVGDRVVVDSYLNMSIITGVLAWALDSGLGTATPTTDGLMSAADKAKLDGIGAGAKAYGNATTSAAGLMSAADKVKLNGIATGANKYTLPAATASTRGGVRVGSGLKVSGDVLSVDNGAYVTLMTEGADGYCAYRRQGALVCVVCDYLKTTAKTLRVLGTLPEGFRPPRDSIGMGYVRGVDSAGQVSVDKDGTVRIWCTLSNSGYFGGSVTFPVA